LYLFEGGSVPAGATFSNFLGLPVILLGFTQPDDNIHAPNENLRIDNYEGGLRTLVRFWERLSETAL
jgi:acetylornithine deacetylase/succinyl-diaminopimelate desuccinylase-like protein